MVFILLLCFYSSFVFFDFPRLAFQTLAKLLTLFKQLVNPHWSAIQYCCFGVWIELASWILSIALIIITTVSLILPSFYTLLIVRTSTIERESKAFGGMSLQNKIMILLIIML